MQKQETDGGIASRGMETQGGSIIEQFRILIEEYYNYRGMEKEQESGS